MPRIAMVDALQACMERHGGRGEALIEVLHEVQQQLGHLSPETLAAVACGLALPLSRVQGVATFYHLFALQPAPPHSCGVCLGTACFVRGAGQILAELEQRLAQPLDGAPGAAGWALQGLSCVGSCAQAPVLLVDGQVEGPLPLGDRRALASCLARLGLPAAAPRCSG
jgi:NADH:ubiquinone oxidoreductase subunit E